MWERRHGSRSKTSYRIECLNEYGLGAFHPRQTRLPQTKLVVAAVADCGLLSISTPRVALRRSERVVMQRSSGCETSVGLLVGVALREHG